MTTQTTTAAPLPFISTLPSPWQASRGSSGTSAQQPIHNWLGLVKAEKLGLADRSVQNMSDMTLSPANNKGRQGL